MRRKMIPFLCTAALLAAAAPAVPVTAGKSAETEISAGQFAVSEGIDGAWSADIFAMDTYMNLKAYGSGAEKALRAAAAEIARLDALLSTGKKDSEISILNREGNAVVSDDTLFLLERSQALSGATDGLFNIAVYPVMCLWGFPDQDFHIPGQEDLEEALALADPDSVRIDEAEKEVRLEKEGMAVDLGGIAKGYTSARIMDIFRSEGVESGLVSLGGNVQALGRKPDGSDWRVAIQNPEKNGEYLGVLSMHDRAMITSGGYERFFEENGVRYHHIIDPRTGYPAESGVISSTVVSADGTLADGLSTSLYIMGIDAAADFWRESAEDFDYVLEAEDGTLYVTEGIEKDFETDRKLEIVRKK